MTDEEIMQGLENACNSATGTFGWTVPPYPILRDYILKLQAENAALHARIDKFDDLHIHMGKPVYIITNDNEIVERFICGIHVLSTEIIFVTAITANYKPCDKKGVAAQGWHCIKNNLGLIPLRYFGERAFTSRAAPEKHLAKNAKG